MLRVILPTKASGHGCRSGPPPSSKSSALNKSSSLLFKIENSYWLSTIINKRHRASHDAPALNVRFGS